MIHPDDELIIAPKSKLHGDQMIKFCWDYIYLFIKSQKNLVLIEIGSERGTGSTYRLSKLCTSKGLKLITVDADPDINKHAGEIARKINPTFENYHELGEVYLEKYPENNIAICYLDAFDIVTDWPHKESSIETYKKRNVDITNQAAYKMHYDASVAVHPKVIEGGFICFDDVWLDSNNIWQGKGKTAIPYLLNLGYEIIAYKTNSLLLQKAFDKEKINVDTQTEKDKINLEEKIRKNRLKSIPKKVIKRFFN